MPHRERLQSSGPIEDYTSERIFGRYEYGRVLPTDSSTLVNAWVAGDVQSPDGNTIYNSVRAPMPWYWLSSQPRTLLVMPQPPQLEPEPRPLMRLVRYFVPPPTSEVDMMADGNADVSSPVAGAGGTTVQFTVPGAAVQRDRRRS